MTHTVLTLALAVPVALVVCFVPSLRSWAHGPAIRWPWETIAAWAAVFAVVALLCVVSLVTS